MATDESHQPLSPLSVSPMNTALQSPPNTSRLASHPSSGSLRAAALPPSPRTSSRHPSISQQSMADLLAQPPPPREDDLIRDWRTVRVGELVKDQRLRFVDLETTVEDACQVLVVLTNITLLITNIGSTGILVVD